MTHCIRFPGKYLQGPEVIEHLGSHISILGKKMLVISSKRTWTQLGAKIQNSSSTCNVKLVNLLFCGECTEQEIQRIFETFQEQQCDFVLAVGGGKVIDTSKAVAQKVNCPLAVLPTSASSDAPCSGVAVIYREDGTHSHGIITDHNPDIVMVDTKIIAQAPPRLLAAGMGDALATWPEACACAKSKGNVISGGHSDPAAILLAQQCHDTILRLGQSAFEAAKQHCVTDEFDFVIRAVVLFSGVGFESGGLAAAHAIGDSFSIMRPGWQFLHGERVAFGTMVQLLLEGDIDGLRKVTEFAKRTGLPYRLEQFGIAATDKEVIRQVAKKAAEAESMKNMPFVISSQDIENAMWAVNN